MIFETIKSNGLASLSYIIGDGGACAVIDPRRDVEAYLAVASEHGAKITHIVETHVHADFVSGSRELAARTGATIYGGRIRNEVQGDYGFDITELENGDTLEIGSIKLRVLYTPGHSSEHLSYVISGGGAGAEDEWAVFTGDSLFAGEVGRPDLEPGADHEELASKLYDSLYDKLMALDDGIEVYPGHGEGSPCGSSIGARDKTTIGYERRHNPRLQEDEKSRFVNTLLGELEEEPMPAYYARLKHLNHEGPQVLGALEALEPYSVDAFEKLVDDEDVTIIDAREIEAFAAAHISGSLNIALRGSFPVWVGRLLDAERDYVLIADDAAAVETARIHLLRIGVDNLKGYLSGGFTSWFNAGKPYESMGLISVHELRRRQEAGEDDLQILDVRSPKEWHSGHIQDAQHIYVPDLPEKMSHLDRERPVLTYCGSGYRASIAASMLAANGFSQVYNLPGSMAAWEAADYPLVDER
ncbi:MAG: MBL fold metallo-hydrolase [Persicimonas sp.]